MLDHIPSDDRPRAFLEDSCSPVQDGSLVRTGDDLWWMSDPANRDGPGGPLVLWPIIDSAGNPTAGR